MSMDAPRFEGSYMGASAKISPAAIMECKICWSVYEPGSWTVAVFESSAMDGQPLNLVSATITVK